MLENGYHDVPLGKIAAVVTHLEMAQQAPLRADPPIDLVDGFILERVQNPDLQWYRALFRRVGAEEWLWFSRLQMDDAALTAILCDVDVHVSVLRQNGADMGLLELDFRTPHECELAFFGVANDLVGTGAGRWMMNRAIAAAWDKNISRFHLQTCSLDHPNALAFYIRTGFAPYRRRVEIADDPRIIGVLPDTAGKRVPIIR